MTDGKNLPVKLKNNYQFCVWRYEKDKTGRQTKIPYDPTSGHHAKSNDPTTFTDYTTADAAAAEYAGVGVRVSGHLTGIDIDHCVEDDGTLNDLASDIVAIMDTYTEFSPSGTGVRILFEVPDGFKYDDKKYYIKNSKIGVEVYVSGMTNRFLTLTGNVFNPADIETRPDRLSIVLDKYMTRPEPEHKNDAPPEPVDLDDRELIDRALNSRDSLFADLYAGRWQGMYKSQSEADLAFCGKLAFWTGRDPERIDRIFRSSGLMRDKWNRDDYRNNTIQSACEQCSEVYTPGHDDNPKPSSPDTPSTPKSVSKTETSSDPEPSSPETTSDDSAFTVYSVQDYIIDKKFENDVEYFKAYQDRKTGFPSIDEYLTLYPGLMALGGSSSLGKTTFCVNLADNLIASGESVLYFSLEQSVIELVTKSISRRWANSDADPELIRHIKNTDIKNGATCPELESVKTKYAADIGDRFNIVRCDFTTTAEQICDYIEKYIKLTGIRPIVIVDYLQLISPPKEIDGVPFKGDTRQAIDHNIKLFKTVQLRNELLVVMVSSFNRSGYNTPVSYEDFKESSMIEFTCDYVVGLQLEILSHHEFYYTPGRNGERQTTAQEKSDMIHDALSEYPEKIQFVSLKSRNGVQNYRCDLDYYKDLDYFLDPLEKRNPYIH